MPERRRVVFVAGSLGRGGAERQLDGWCRELARLGWETAVVTTDAEGAYRQTLERRGVTVRVVSRRCGTSARAMRVALATRQLRPDVVQAVQAHVNLHAVLAARFSRVRCVGALRTAPGRAVEALGAVGPLALRLPDILVGNCREHLGDAVDKHGVIASRTALLPNWVDLDTTPPSGPGAHDEVVLVFVSRLVPVKRPLDAVRALAELLERGTRARLVVVGDGPLRAQIEGEAAQLGISSHVEMLGQVADARPAIADATVMIQCSETEGSPNAILEAMAQEIPVVATAVGDSRNLLADGRGSLVPVGDPSAIASMVSMLVQRPDELSEVATRARRHVEEHHALGTVGFKLDRLLRAALVERG